MDQQNQAKVFFPNLDGLRYVAFFAVFVQHAFGIEFEKHFPTSYMLNKVCNFAVWSGGYGVSLFFVLSGFLITYLLLKEQEVKERIHVGAFYLRRTLRIWPLYFLLVLYGLFVFAQHEGFYETLSIEKWKYFYFASNFACLVPGGNISPISITWSVSVEEQFYLLWPLLFFFTPRRWQVLICPLIMALSLAFRIAHHTEKDLLYFHTFSLMYDLALGGLCAYLAVYSKSFVNLFARTPFMLRVLLYIAGLGWLIFGQSIQPEGWYLVTNRMGTTAFFAWIILDQNFSSGRYLKFGNNKFLSRWGKYTYGMYLLHPLLQAYVEKFTWPLAEQMSLMGKVILAGAVTIVVVHAVCYLSFHYFEQPFLKLKKKFAVVKSGE